MTLLVRGPRLIILKMVQVHDWSYPDERGARDYAVAAGLSSLGNLLYQYYNAPSGQVVAPATTRKPVAKKKMPPKSAMKRGRRGYARAPRKKARKMTAKKSTTRARTFRRRRLAVGSRPIARGAVAKSSKAQRLGCVRKIELGGLVSDLDCVYVGHCTQPGIELTKMWARSIVRALLRKAGMGVTSWEQPIPFNGTTTDNVEMILKVFYRQNGGSANVGITSGFDTEALPQISITPNQTMRVISTSLYNQFNNIVSADEDAILTRVELHTSDPPLAVAKFVCASSKVHMRLHSKLVVQNRTRSSDSAQTGELVNDVTNNPVVGYRYGTSGTGFRVRNISNGTDTNLQIGVGFFGNNSTGLITARALTTNISPSKKPLYGSDFQGKVSVNKIQILPGACRVDTLKESATYSFNYMWSRFKEDIKKTTTGEAQAGREYFYQGKCAMIGVEKLCNTRDGNEPSVIIGYELTKTYHMHVTGSETKYCMPFVDVLGGTDFVQNQNPPPP